MARIKRLSQQSAGREKQIAVIEEIADNIYSIKFILQSLSYRVESFSSREDYVAGLRRFDPKLIIVDMLIAGGGGFEVIRRIRQAGFQDIPILAITAEAMLGDADEVLQAGAVILEKPYTISDLQVKLEELLR